MVVDSVILSLLIAHLPLRLHSPFSKSNIQFPLQPSCSELLCEVGQYVQSGYSFSPPQDTVTEYQGSIDFDGSLYLTNQALQEVLTNFTFFGPYPYYTIFLFQWSFENPLVLYTTHRIHRRLMVEIHFQPCKECHYFQAVRFLFDSNILRVVVDKNE